MYESKLKFSCGSIMALVLGHKDLDCQKQAEKRLK